MAFAEGGRYLKFGGEGGFRGEKTPPKKQGGTHPPGISLLLYASTLYQKMVDLTKD